MAGHWRKIPQVKSQQLSRLRAACNAEYLEFVAEVRVTMAEMIPPLLNDAYVTAGVCGAADYHRDLETLKNRLHHEGVKFTTTVLPKLFDSVIQELETGVQHYPGFSVGRNGRPVLLRKLTSLAFSTVSSDRARGLSSLYQIAYAFKKLKGPYQFSVLLEHVENFVKVDKEIGNIDLFGDPLLREVLLHAKGLVTKLFRGINLDMITSPHPGPGATNTPVEKCDRYEPHTLYRNVDDTFDYQEWFYSHPWDAVCDSKAFLALHLNAKNHATARFKHVYKTVGKPRGICIEENEMQWFQQGLKDLLVSWIERHPMTKGYINFSRQSINQKLALISSIDRLLATIDMSDASDRVLRCLVLFLFRDTELFDALAALSTPIITFPKTYQIGKLQCNKYAPMGSGLCFPTMAVVHWALIHGIMHNSMSAAPPVYVYGDDIILPSNAVKVVYNMLPRFGMKINKTKSFYRSHFRESCGLHAYDGVEITPVFIKKIPTSTLLTTPEILTIIAQERDLYKKGFVETAQWLRLKAKLNLPKVMADSGILGWIREDPLECTSISMHSVKKRYNPHHHCWEYKVRLVRAKTEKSPPLVDHKAYLRKHVHKVKVDAAKVDGCPLDHVIYWGWTRLTVSCKVNAGLRSFIDRKLNVVEHHTITA